MANALELKQVLKQPIPEDLNMALLERYPELKTIVYVKSDQLTPVQKR